MSRGFLGAIGAFCAAVLRLALRCIAIALIACAVVFVVGGERAIAGCALIAALVLWIISRKPRRAPNSRRSASASQPFPGVIDDWTDRSGLVNDDWKNDPASDRQKSFADDLGIEYPPDILKGELSGLIDGALESKRRGWES